MSISQAGVFSCANTNLTCSGATQVAKYNVEGSNNQTVHISAPIRVEAVLLSLISLLYMLSGTQFILGMDVPTFSMLGATTLEAVKHRHEIMSGAGVGFGLIAVGFVVSFVVALIVVRAFVHYISRHGFAPSDQVRARTEAR